LLDIDQAVLVAVDQRLEQDAAHQCENGGIGADAQSQRQDDSQSHAPGMPERVKCHTQIAKKRHVDPLASMSTTNANVKRQILSYLASSAESWLSVSGHCRTDPNIRGQSIRTCGGPACCWCILHPGIYSSPDAGCACTRFVPVGIFEDC